MGLEWRFSKAGHASKPTPGHVNQVVLLEYRVVCRASQNSKITITLHRAIGVLNFQSPFVRKVRKPSGQRDEICKGHFWSPIIAATQSDLSVDEDQCIRKLD